MKVRSLEVGQAMKPCHNIHNFVVKYYQGFFLIWLVPFMTDDEDKYSPTSFSEGFMGQPVI